MAGRAVYGRVYELVLRDQPPDSHAYVGKVTAPTTIHQRVFGRSASAHTSPQSVTHDPWKAEISPGRAGYRLLETVYDTGDEAENDRALRRAEAFWIDRLRPTHNIVRPVRPAGAPLAPRARGRAVAARPLPPARARRTRRRPVKPFVLLAFIAAFTYLSARTLLMMELPWPQVPWVGAPMLGVALGWSTFWKLHRSIRRLLR